MRKAAGRLPSAPLISRLSLCAVFETLAASVSEWHRTSILSGFPNIGKTTQKRRKGGRGREKRGRRGQNPYNAAPKLRRPRE